MYPCIHVHIHARIYLEQRDNEPETETEPDVATNTRKTDEITTVHNSTGGSATNIKIIIRKLCCMVIQ